MGKNRIYGMVVAIGLIGLIGRLSSDGEPQALADSVPVSVRAIEQAEASTTVLAQTTIPLSPTTTTAPPYEGEGGMEPIPEVTEPVTVTQAATPIPSPVVEAYRGNSDKMCWEWLDLAREVGWPEEELSKLGYIMWRESRCDPMAWNQEDPTPDGSRGLTQINGFWCRPSKYNPDGYLQTFHPELLAFSGTCQDLHDPAINLRAAKALYDYGVERGNNPWTPWGG